MRYLLLPFAWVLFHACSAQAFTSYFTGNTQDAAVDALGGTCMMGGATEHDGAMAWFLSRAAGGDVLVLRASGSNGYNAYMYSEIGGVNSVETIVFHTAAAANDPYVAERIGKAEAIWFAGGDQWNYVSYWRNTPVAAAINAAIAERNVAIGGTSAGMAILGGYYFSAQNGSVSSASALADPYGTAVTVDDAPFLQLPYLAEVITDTHYDDPDRRGRHTAFLARIRTDHGILARGIACNEYVAVTVDPDGIARVYGEWPAYQEYAFFLQVNCVPPSDPELCEPGSPLHWQRHGEAVKVYKVPGLMQGGNWFDLNDWRTGEGGAWEHWTVSNGVFSAVLGTPMDCDTATTTAHVRKEEVQFSWGPAERVAVLQGLPAHAVVDAWYADGRRCALRIERQNDRLRVSVTGPMGGMVLLQARAQGYSATWKLLP